MTNDKDKDAIFAKPVENIEDFRFDEAVATVFDDMINRSVPGYSSVIAATGALADLYIDEDGVCYDLGCSLGATSLSILQHCQDKRFTLIAVDNAQAMINKARQVLVPGHDGIEVKLICEDIRNVDIQNASVVVLNFVLQFIDPEERENLLTQIFSGLRAGGCLIISEKVKFGGPEQQQYFEHQHYQFKKSQGYSDLEISQKRSALEEVLVPEGTDDHLSRLRHVGFSNPRLWFQDLCFASFLAFKQ